MPALKQFLLLSTIGFCSTHYFGNYRVAKNLKQIISLPRKILLGLLLANSIHFGVGGFFSNSGVALTSAVNAGFLVKFAPRNNNTSGLDIP